MPITLLYALWKTGWGVNDCFTASGWTPEGRRARGRPKSTWRRRKSWAVVKAVAQDRKCWSGSSMEALCANWRDEIWWWLDMMTHDDDALWNLTLAKKLPVIDKITASCPTNIPPRHYIKRCKQQNELIEKLLDSKSLKFAKTLLQSGFNLLQVWSPAVPKFVFAVLFVYLLFTFWAVLFMFYTHFCGSFPLFQFDKFPKHTELL